jgi:hypothetical protein
MQAACDILQTLGIHLIFSRKNLRFLSNLSLKFDGNALLHVLEMHHFLKDSFYGFAQPLQQMLQ